MAKNKIINRIYTSFILLFTTLIILSCTKGDDGPIVLIPNRVQASFDISISTTDPYVLLLNNTTSGNGDYKSEWDFGLGDGLVLDQPDVEEVRYDVPGDYEIKLIVTNAAGATEAVKAIKVDINGICPNGFCGAGNGTALKDVATTFSVGMVSRSGWINGGGDHTTVLSRDFNNITAEYEMKMNIMYPSQGVFDFTAADAIVNFAQANNMEVHGHALIWHNATPDWVNNFSGSDAAFEAMVEDYITTTVTRYKGQVRSWDVVNEALEDSSGHPLRNSVFRQRMGDDYIKKCFQWARNADPDALLFYNDYNMAASPSKRQAMFNLVDNLGDLVDGVGAQMHISYNGPSASNIEAVANGTVSRGLKLHFSELDIRANPNNDLTELTGQRANEQKEKYKEVVQIYNAIPLENKFALTVWGMRDNESWLINFWGHIDWPLMYDENYAKKPAYIGFLEGLQ